MPMSMFDPIAAGVWCHRAQYRFGALEFPHAVTVIRKHDGGLIVHSPAKIDGATRDALKSLGSVSTILWPSWWHDLYLRAWADAYPDARLFVAPDLRSKVKGMSNARMLSESSDVDSDVDIIAVDGLNVWFDEFVVMHRPSRTLVVADLVVNVGPDLAFPTSAFFALMGARSGPFIPWFYRLVAHDKQRLRSQLDRISGLGFERLIVGHGDAILTDPRVIFANAVERLFQQKDRGGRP
jgi:hypothetical protein